MREEYRMGNKGKKNGGYQRRECPILRKRVFDTMGKKEMVFICKGCKLKCPIHVVEFKEIYIECKVCPHKLKIA